MNYRKNVQLEEFAIHLDADIVPVGPLRSAGIVDQDVQGLELIDYHVEVIVVMIYIQHIHLQHVDIVRSESTIGLRYCRDWENIESDVNIFPRAYSDIISCSLPIQSCLTLSSSEMFRADRHRRTPFFASAIAKSRPIPLDAPVIQTTFPFRDAI